MIRHDRNGHPYNAAAGPILNAEMIALGADMVIALHRDIGASKGTRDCVRQTLAAGIAVYLIDGDDAVLRPVRAGDPRLG